MRGEHPQGDTVLIIQASVEVQVQVPRSGSRASWMLSRIIIEVKREES